MTGLIAVLILMSLFCGVMAMRHIDKDKIGTLPKRTVMAFGPLVPEASLTATGRKWARFRNIFAALFSLLAIGCAVYLRLKQGE